MLALPFQPRADPAPGRPLGVLRHAVICGLVSPPYSTGGVLFSPLDDQRQSPPYFFHLLFSRRCRSWSATARCAGGSFSAMTGAGGRRRKGRTAFFFPEGKHRLLRVAPSPPPFPFPFSESMEIRQALYHPLADDIVLLRARKYFPPFFSFSLGTE